MSPTPLNAWPELLRSSANRSLVRRFERGELVRIQPGYYVERMRWERSTAAERFIATATAKHQHGPAVFCGESALLLLGFPTFGPPPALTLAVSSGSRAGRGAETLVISPGTAAPSGYRHPLPQVRRHHHPAAAHSSAGEFAILDPVECLVEMLQRAPLTRSLVVTDAVLRDVLLSRSGGSDDPRTLVIDPAAARRAVLALPPGIRRQRATLALDRSSAGAQSPGESVSRAIMIEAGLAAPQLQQEHWDERGLIGYTDFSWPEIGVIGEFDGRAKYNGTFGPGAPSAEQAVWNEKQRENRLTRLGFRVIRWTWADLYEPERLIRTLRAAGVPLAVPMAA